MALRAAYHLAKNVLRANVATPPYPYKITCAVTYRCNSRCHTCRVWRKEDPREEMDLAEIERFFRASSEIAWMDLTGGEPFLRDDFVEICGAAILHCRRLYLLHFPTNGLLVDRVASGVRDILELRPNRLIVSVSVDGPRDLHDEIRGGRGFFDRAVETLRRLRAMSSRRFHVYPGMTLSERNLGQVDATLEALARELPGFAPDDLHVNIAQVSPHVYDNEGMDTTFRATAVEEMAIFARRKGHLGMVPAMERAYLKLASGFAGTGRTPLPCQALSSSCYIAPDGAIYPCVGEDEIVGHLKDHSYSLREAWSSARVREARARIKRGTCAQCWTPCEAYQTLCARLGTVVRCQLG
jgi:radical SAM protein with 4Fe4S-binding SPASM domain